MRADLAIPDMRSCELQPSNPNNLLDLERILVDEVEVNLLPAIATKNGSIVQPLASLLEQMRPEEGKHLQTHRMLDLAIRDCF